MASVRHEDDPDENQLLMAQVILERVTKMYPGGILAVKDVSLTVADRELLVLVGPSGCGKSTTLRIVAGLEEATEGVVRIGDRVVYDVAPKDRDIAMVFQNYALYPHMTVFENMAFGLKLRKYPKAEIQQRVADAARILDIQRLLERKPKALSGGERQRVAVGRAIVRKPAVFLFDEPLSNLDAKLRVEMRAELKRLHQRLQTTMIYVTHDQIEAMTLGDRITVMKDGLTQQVDDPITVYDRPINRFVAGFLGTPPMNFIEGALESVDGRLTFRFGKGGLLPVAPAVQSALKDRSAGRITLGIRPESLYTLEPSASGAHCVAAKVNVVEPLGNEMILYVTADGQDLVCRVDSHARVSVGQAVAVKFDMDKAHFFDVETGNNVVLE